MKSFFTWLVAIIIGAIFGYLVNVLTGYNLYLSIGIGIILGSTIGITINIHRKKQRSKIDRQVVPEAEEKDEQQ